MKTAAYFLYLLVLTVLLGGFSLKNAIIPVDDILSGGPPKDGIPAILEPKFVSASKAAFLKEDDQIIGVVIGKLARAYPINILNWHEAVNDTLGNTPLVVSF